MTVKDLEKTGFSENRIFSSLNSGELEQLASQVDFLEFENGQTVFSAGNPSTQMFFVASGEIAVMNEDDYGNSREIARIIKGDTLGEIDMISGTKRTVTAIASLPVSLIAFPRKGLPFPEFLEQHPKAGSKILFAFIKDIAERTRHANDLLKENSPHIQELRRQIYEDKLTHTLNKTWLEENLPEFLQSREQPITLMMVKPDNFKQVNDQAGHDAGDKLLVHLARLLPAVVPQKAQIVRYIGNEFAIVLEGTGRDAAKSIAERIQDFYNTLDVMEYLPVPDFHLTVSTGVALYPENGKNATTLIESAHALPLVGRAQGGNRILFSGNQQDKPS